MKKRYQKREKTPIIKNKGGEQSRELREKY
jgi:hypothetical protein